MIAGVLAICQLRTHAVKEVSDQHFVRTRPSRSTSAVVNSTKQLAKRLAKQPGSSRHSDLRTNYKQFGLKTITSQIENQPANHARSTNVHRATHAENYAHCVNCETNCFETSNANLLRDSFELLAQQRIRWHSNQLHHIVSSQSSTFQISAAFCSTMKHPVCIRPIVDLIHLQTRSSRFQTQRDSVSFKKT